MSGSSNHEEIVINTDESVVANDFSKRNADVKNDVMAKLLWNLDTSSLLQLKQFFHKLNDDTATDDVPRYDFHKHREKRTLYISRADFENAVNSVFGNTEFKTESKALFESLDTEKTGFIWWEHLLDHLIECGEKRTRRNMEGWSPIRKDKIKIIDVPHCKKECVSFVVPIETDSTFCYVIISKYGKVGVYDGRLRMLAEYDVFFMRTGVSRRVRDVWITAAKNLEDSKTLLLAASDRTLTIYDSSTLYHVPIFLITGIPYIPTFMSYNPSKEKGDSSCLVMGDDHGGITLLTFKQPRVGLFFKQIQDKMNTIIWMDLQCILQETYCDIKIHRRLHARPVKKLVYIKLNDSIVSCSSDPNVSLIIRHRKGTRESYIFKVTKGISCFHYSVIINVLITGSSDGRVRIWDPTTTHKPTAILPVQSASIMDLIIMTHISAVITFNKNGELKVWDILNTVCTQSLHISYPSFGILGRLIQFGSVSIFNGPGREEIFKDIKIKTNKKPVPKVIQSDAQGNEGILKFDSLQDGDMTDTAYENMVDEEKAAELFQWNRSEILVACCNHIAIVPIQDASSFKQDSEESKYPPTENKSLLPPPEKSHRPRKPSVWSDEQYNFDQSSVPAQLTTAFSMEDCNKKKPHSIVDMRQLLVSSDSKHDEELKFRSIVDTEDMSLDDLLQRAGLTGILEKDFVKQFGIKHDMNARLALQKSKMEKMRLQVAQGAPYSTLELQEPSEIKFSSPLPLSTRMQKKSGLDHFTNPEQILLHNSCFSMSSPRSSYTISSTNTSKKSDTSLDNIK